MSLSYLCGDAIEGQGGLGVGCEEVQRRLWVGEVAGGQDRRSHSGEDSREGPPGPGTAVKRRSPRCPAAHVICFPASDRSLGVLTSPTLC